MLVHDRAVRRRALFVLAVFVALAVVGGGKYLRALAGPSPRVAPPVAVPPPPAPSDFAWRLTSAMSAHRALVVEVETPRPGEALLVAQQLVPLYQDRFDEVLLFFFDPNVQPRRAKLRVQWTRRNGYHTLALRGPE
jgi:hypothetical protein